jgi:putative membrane protein
MKFIVRMVVNAVAIYVAVALLNGHGLSMEDQNWTNFFWLALIFALVNTFLKPIMFMIGCPLLVLTAGLGALLINTLLFYLVASIGNSFGVGFQVITFWGAFLGSIIVSVASFALNALLGNRP